MPRFKVRLEDPKSDHFRVTYVTAKDKNEARAICEQREQRFVATRYTDDELKLADDRGSRGHLAIHEQSEPYKVKAVAKRDQKWSAS